MLERERHHLILNILNERSILSVSDWKRIPVQAQRKLLKRTERVIVMADSSKLRRQSSLVVSSLTNIATLITDSNASVAELAEIRTAGVEVILVPVEEESGLQQPA